MFCLISYTCLCFVCFRMLSCVVLTLYACVYRSYFPMPSYVVLSAFLCFRMISLCVFLCFSKLSSNLTFFLIASYIFKYLFVFLCLFKLVDDFLCFPIPSVCFLYFPLILDALLRVSLHPFDFVCFPIVSYVYNFQWFCMRDYASLSGSRCSYNFVCFPTVAYVFLNTILWFCMLFYGCILFAMGSGAVAAASVASEAEQMLCLFALQKWRGGLPRNMRVTCRAVLVT